MFNHKIFSPFTLSFYFSISFSLLLVPLLLFLSFLSFPTPFPFSISLLHGFLSLPLISLPLFYTSLLSSLLSQIHSPHLFHLQISFTLSNSLLHTLSLLFHLSHPLPPFSSLPSPLPFSSLPSPPSFFSFPSSLFFSRMSAFLFFFHVPFFLLFLSHIVSSSLTFSPFLFLSHILSSLFLSHFPSLFISVKFPPSFFSFTSL